MKRPLGGPIVALFLLLLSIPTSANIDGNTLATGNELLLEMNLLQAALGGLQDLIQTAQIPAEDEIVSKTVKLVRRVRSLVHATSPGQASDGRNMSQLQRRAARREARNRERKMLRAGGIGNGAVEEVAAAQPPQQPGMEDYVTRKLFDATLTFPECKQKFLNDCIEILNQQLAELQMEADIITHSKRNIDQDGYNKVVIVTDLSATYVKGRLNDGVVDYPFLWDDGLTGNPRMLGVNGHWDCHSLSPDECCEKIKLSCPAPDHKGNMLTCHIFVPFGGAGNKKRDDRVFVNLSPDGRVQEAPFVA